MSETSKAMTTTEPKPLDHWQADPRIGTLDVNSWRAVPVEGNTEGKRTWLWPVVAGDYADEGEPDIYIEVTGEYPKDIAEFIVQAVQEKWARLQETAEEQ
jgi:hypothetical protein